MREILFRGKAVGSLKWVEGFYFREAGSFIKELPSAVSTETHMVYEDTIGQYTGLTDKNGKKIFEGDIVKIEDFTHGCALNYKQPTSNWVVHWREDIARFCIDYMSYLPFDFTQTEVIGNIHDNPELLKGGAE